MDLNEMLVFARVVSTGSFTAAGKTLGMPKSTVSRKVSELEARLESRLLQRTTRKLSLTDVGRTYYEYCARILGEVEDAERAVSSLHDAPRGLLRVTAPVNAAFLGPIVSSYLARYPDVRVELACTARSVDLVEEGYDVGIRAGTLADSTLIARSLGHVRWFLVATTAYIEKRGRPRTPDALRHHDCLIFGTPGDPATLRLESGAKSVRVAVSPRLAVGDMDILRASALEGLGIALLPSMNAVDDLRSRRVERILPQWEAPATPVQLVYPSARHLSPKVRSFADHVQARMTPPPWELGPAP